MTIIVSSIPNTGTFLVCGFLDFIGKGYLQCHLDNLPYDNDFLVMPIRDPALNFLSYRKRNPRAQFDGLLAETNRWWRQFIAIADRYDPFLVPTDKGADIGAATLTELAMKLNVDLRGRQYGWPVVGGIGAEPSSMDEYRSISKAEQQIIFKRLEDVRGHLGYAD